ncbi:MAG: CysZ protein [Thermoproteota archaeon]|jgi:CysZ protein
MVKSMFTSLTPSIRYILKDKVNFTLASIPVAIGVALYLFLGKWMYGSVLTSGQEMIKSKISEGTLGSALYWIIAAVMTVILFFIINWTFVLIVSVIASPFNDLISSRIEKLMNGETPEDLSSGFTTMLKNLSSTLWNESKKLILILILTAVAFGISFIPLLVPVSIALSAILLSVQFLDYSWARHQMTVSECFGNVTTNLVTYLLMGGLFMICVSIPVINLVIPALATSYYTVYFVNKRK